jgi:hypothetical protein
LYTSRVWHSYYARSAVSTELRKEVVSRIVGISTVFIIPVGPEVGVDDLTDPLDVHNLLHCLSAGIDGDQVVAGLDEISGSTAAESSSSSSTSAALTTATGAGATDRSFCRAQIYLTGRSAPALPSPTTAACETAAGLDPLAERAQPGSVATRAHRVHGVANGGERRRVTARRRYPPGPSGRVNTASRT